MKIVSWNVRGICSQFKMHEVWRILLNKQWDVLCAVEHKAHANAGLVTCSHGYTLCYAGKDPGSYSGIVMFIRTHYNPQIILNDDFGRYMVVQIAYEGQLIWLVGVYASNVSRERKLLWQSLASLLRDGRPGLLMGDFNACCEVAQSTSKHAIMDRPEAEAWEQLQSDVLHQDVWTWLHGDASGYTFQSPQYVSTWSRLDRMYVMHSMGFLPEILDISVSYDLVLSDHFPLVFEFVHQSVDSFRHFLRQPPLRFNSSFLDNDIFNDYMHQLLEVLVTHIHGEGFVAWDVFVANVQKLSKFYGIYNAFQRKKKLHAMTTLLGRCNVLLTYWPRDAELLEMQQFLSTYLHELQIHNYQQARLFQMVHESEDNNCQSHKFFRALHESHARYNVVRIEEDGHVVTDPKVIVQNCVEYYKKLLDVDPSVDDNVMYARDVFFRGVLNHVPQEVADALDADFSEEEVAHVVSHLANDKSPGWDGLTNEFFKKYVLQLQGVLVILFQKVWLTGHMPKSWKVGLIKLLPKVPSPMSFAQWRPISLMGGIYKIFTKVLANRLRKVLPIIIHHSQYGFIVGRDILHNILNVQLAIEFAKETNQEMVMLQLDLEKAYDNVDWSFVCQLMHQMGFGNRMSRLIYTLGEASVSHVMLNGGITEPISIRRSVRQGCPVSPLLFTIVTHAILVKLHQLAEVNDLVGLRLPSGKPCVAQALADDHIMFLGATPSNIATATKMWELFALASGLKVNMHKSVLISCTERDILNLGWPGKMVTRGEICRHLGYPIGVDVSHVKLLEWVSNRLQNKFMYWKSQFWPFHVRLKVVQSIMIPMVSYYLPLLPWSKKVLATVTKPMRQLLWKKKGYNGISWIAWDHVCTPKRLGGAALLNVFEHMVARRVSMLKFMFEGSQPWTEMMAFFIRKLGIKFGNMQVEMNWWNVVNSQRQVRCTKYWVVNQFLSSWQSVLDFIYWNPPSQRLHGNSLQLEILATSRLLDWENKATLQLQFNRMARLGLITIQDAMLVAQKRLMAFRTARSIFRIPHNYKSIWEKFQELPILNGLLPNLVEEHRALDWTFVGDRGLTLISTNVAYHAIIERYTWLSPCLRKVWSIDKPNAWWMKVIRLGWHSPLPFKYKVFLWRVLIGGLPLGHALITRRIASGICFLCPMEVEHSCHRFISCPMAKDIWQFINAIWMSISGVARSPFKWVFALLGWEEVAPHYHFILSYLRYWGLCFIWQMRNAFVFDAQQGVRKYMVKLKGVLLWQFTLLARSRHLTDEERPLCRLVC